MPNCSISPNMWPQPTQNPFYNINAFAYPAQFTQGNAGKWDRAHNNWYGSNGTLRGVLRIAF